MLLLDPTPPPEPVEPERLRRAVSALEGAIAEQGPLSAVLDRASDLCRDCVALARGTAGEAPAAAFALMDGCRQLVEALSRGEAASTAPREAELLDALDAVHLGLLAILDNDPIASRRPLREVVGWLCAALGVTQRDLAAGIAVPERTLQRWLLDETAIPPAQRQRLELVIRGLNELRFVFRGGLALTWLATPNRGASGRRPLDLLEQPADFLRLAAVARF